MNGPVLHRLLTPGAPGPQAPGLLYRPPPGAGASFK
jgi:hypothetical protein